MLDINLKTKTCLKGQIKDAKNNDNRHGQNYQSDKVIKILKRNHPD